MRLALLTKANESLPATSRLSDGSKFLFLPPSTDEMILCSLDKMDSTLKNRLQSTEMISSLKNSAENIYESILDSCTTVVKISDHPEVIRTTVSISSQVFLFPFITFPSFDSFFYFFVFLLWMSSWPSF
jgi:hypothetical protein